MNVTYADSSVGYVLSAPFRSGSNGYFSLLNDFLEAKFLFVIAVANFTIRRFNFAKA